MNYKEMKFFPNDTNTVYASGPATPDVLETITVPSNNSGSGYVAPVMNPAPASTSTAGTASSAGNTSATTATSSSAVSTTAATTTTTTGTKNKKHSLSGKTMKYLEIGTAIILTALVTRFFIKKNQ